MSTGKVFRLVLALCWLLPAAIGSAAAANIADYAKSVVNETFLSEPRRPGISIAFVGATPPGDRLVLSFSLTPFVWVTSRPNRVTDVADADLVVNATAAREEILVAVGPGQTLVDLPYPETATAAAARRAGARVIGGLEVLVAQGAASFELWTGLPAPVDVMRAAVGLGPPP